MTLPFSAHPQITDPARLFVSTDFLLLDPLENSSTAREPYTHIPTPAVHIFELMTTEILAPPKIPAQPWKSGASAPRKVFELKEGFSPCESSMPPFMLSDSPELSAFPVRPLWTFRLASVSDFSSPELFEPQPRNTCGLGQSCNKLLAPCSSVTLRDSDFPQLHQKY